VKSRNESSCFNLSNERERDRSELDLLVMFLNASSMKLDCFYFIHA